jgi:hypothetical protein
MYAASVSIIVLSYLIEVGGCEGEIIVKERRVQGGRAGVRKRVGACDCDSKKIAFEQAKWRLKHLV